MKCLDTYALVEIRDGNPKFVLLLDEDIIFPDTTMAEFYAVLYRKHGLQTAEYWHDKLCMFSKPVSHDIMLKAVRFRIDNKNQNFSFFDAVGYVFAVDNKMQFVTGDKEFRNMPGVVFIQK
ncbi:PIN domain-containing protein [Candidatus Woesearchaeota archaeon]|nr:PIN domain-containing protein [Candidatus Woesearchaeota archaeon]